ncbi:MAG: polyprenyl synthetase family protein [Prolixibacteraceae bacterium]|nr:polyprenyl synthetase family protein [Prolixibacteraceae bacterium]
MFETKRLLKVPENRKVRNDLRKAVRLHFAENKVLPPSNLETLEIHAEKILSKLNLNSEFLDFTIVLAGNEIWRETVASVPFNRRLLLLPQCLKSQLSCKAEIDELGLICAGCGSCKIDSILSRAEELGYSTLVAEGTTVAIGLVEEGSIDAVIGVSCMSVLQKSFEPVTQAAVPAIGIPLLYEGCVETTADYDWLFSEMELFAENEKIRPISVSLIKNDVLNYFTGENLQKHFNSESVTAKLAAKMMGMGGHRMRPLLSVLAYQSYTKDFSEKVQESLSVIIECFHKASLIHDDIEDDEDERYGQPTIHRTEGIPVAINVGDYLIGKGYMMLANNSVNAEIISKCLKVVAASHTRLSEGQGDDIRLYKNIFNLSVDDITGIFSQKTGEAVKVALLTGAICGNAPEIDLTHLKAFSEFFGIAYQIRDDLNEYREENDLKNAFDFPFLLVLLNLELKGSGISLKDLIHGYKLNGLAKEFEKFEIEKKAETWLDQFLQKCYQELDQLLNLKLRLSLYAVMGKVFKK